MARDIGLTKTAARNMALKGYPHSFITSINRSRPKLPEGVEFIATPVQGEDLMLYSFKDPQAGQDFLSVMPDARPL